MKYRIEEIIAAMNGSWPQAPAGMEIDGYSIDSRTVQEGELFFAFRGEVRDGHEFVPMALDSGAAAAVVRSNYTNEDVDPGRLIRCESGLKAMHDLASFSRDEKGLKLVGITGSCGKTTTKDVTAALLGACIKTEKSWGNYNNIWGMPLALLRRDAGAEAYVCEMGMSFPGELARVTQIARPDIMILTNVRPVHLVNFNSLQEIAEAKAEAFQGLRQGGVIVANADDPEVMRVASRENTKLFTFGIEKKADLSISSYSSLGVDGITFTLDYDGKTFDFETPLPGVHNLYNLMAGLSAGINLELDIDTMMAGLAKVELSPLRGSLIEMAAGWTLFDDSYNSNPAALSSVLKMIADSERFSGKIAVIGDMLELGGLENEAHREIGKLVAELGFSRLITVGPLAALAAESALVEGLGQEQVIRCESVLEAAATVGEVVRAGDIVLIKGSRGVKLDQAVSNLVEADTGHTRENGVKQTL
jgi:UDP-N-acetylmuramoyl-tripeptide--D-alanyl-D-alanine ligase